MKFLWGLTGSVATTLVDKIRVEVTKIVGSELRFIATESAIKIDKRVGTKYRMETAIDEDEWTRYNYEKSVLHIDLAKEYDVFIIAPCSANTLGKIANGLCDNLLTCCLRAWPLDKPVIIAPSMNSVMYSHPITQEHIIKLKSWGHNIIDPIEKKLFCGDYGVGAMANIDDIISYIEFK